MTDMVVISNDGQRMSGSLLTNQGD
jgi:hypothetical protein